VWLRKSLVYGFAAASERPGHPAQWLALHDGNPGGITGRFFNRFDTSEGILLLTDVEVSFSERDIRYGESDGMPSGALILANGGHEFLVKVDLNQFSVDLATGAIGGADLWKSFWLPKWKLTRSVGGLPPVTIFEFGTTT